MKTAYKFVIADAELCTEIPVVFQQHTFARLSFHDTTLSRTEQVFISIFCSMHCRAWCLTPENSRNEISGLVS